MRLARSITRGSINRPFAEDGAAHDWYRFVLSFPPHLVRGYLDQFQLRPGHRVLDPFCGTGTTLVESKKNGIGSVGLEANHFAHFASTVKIDWTPDADDLRTTAREIGELATLRMAEQGTPEVEKTSMGDFPNLRNDLRGLPPDAFKLLLTNSISPIPLHKALILLETISEKAKTPHAGHLRLAFANALVHNISNLHFGPEVGVAPPKKDTPVVTPWLRNALRIANDLDELKANDGAGAVAISTDGRAPGGALPPNSIDAVITSPPYPNEKDYTRTTRLESVLLGFVTTKKDLQTLKRGLVRSNTRTIYKGDSDDEHIADNVNITDLASRIESRRIELKKTSGFERLYATVTKQYFGGMARHLADLRGALRPGANLVYIVGDQASFFRILIRTGKLLGDIAESLGYQVVDLQLFRTRAATATRELLREEGLILHWPSTAVSTNMPVRNTEKKATSMATNGAKQQTPNRYAQIIEKVFSMNYKEGATEVPFLRTDIETVAAELGINLPKNLGDIIYSFRYRVDLPASITSKAMPDMHWLIRPKGKGRYSFELTAQHELAPNPLLATTLIPDSTPGLVSMYALDDEQALLAKLRYNRLIDIATGVTCYSIQNHLRTQVPGMGQVETDELYVGVTKRGDHYVIPVQAKGGRDKMNIVQIEQDAALCAVKFPNCICRPIAAQFMADGGIAIFEFESSPDGPRIASEKHYKLVPPAEVTPEVLRTYRERLPAD